MDLFKLADFLNNQGFVVDPTKIKGMGQWNVVPLVDNPKGYRSGSFKIMNKELCVYHNFKTGETDYYTERSHNKKVDYQEMQRQAKKQQQELKNLRYQKSLEAYQEYNAIDNFAETSSYLERKKIAKLGCKIGFPNNSFPLPPGKNPALDANIYIPFRNSKGYITSYQTITPEGFKLFKKEAEIKGSSAAIGFNKIFSLGDKYIGKILFAEGYATAMSIHMATGLPTVITANAGNLVPVVQEYKEKYPNAKLAVCADWDLQEKITKHGVTHSNLGVEKAIECQQLFKTAVIIPDFKNITHTNNKKLSDFNDLHCELGLDEVAKQISKGLELEKKHSREIPSNLNKNTLILIQRDEGGTYSKVEISSNKDILNYIENNISSATLKAIIAKGSIESDNCYCDIAKDDPVHLASSLSSVMRLKLTVGRPDETFIRLNNREISFREFNPDKDYEQEVNKTEKTRTHDNSSEMIA